MSHEDTYLDVSFDHDEPRRVALSDLVTGLTAFLDQFGETSLTGSAFAAVIKTGDGDAKLARLLEATGFADAPEGFFQTLLAALSKADGAMHITVNGIAMPHRLLVAVLEIVLPGNRFISVKTVDQLEQLTSIHVPEAERTDMQRVIDTYPVRLSMHTIRQMRVSRDVAYQYLPFIEELGKVGHTNTWIGQFHQGLLEQMYENRVIFLLNMSCPVYCRFCFRKHKDSRNEANPTVEDVKKAVDHVRRSPSIKEVVVTGGDPFMSRTNMAAAIDGLMEVDHVQTLRLATRAIAYYPHMFLANEGAYLTWLKRKHLELQERGKRMEVATHFIHPDEISPQSLSIITELVNSGVAVYVQTPFLNDCNDTGPELVALFSLLRGAGAELHYIYIPCSPIHGNSIYWSPISKGLAVGSYLRAHLSDRVIPRICTATPIGKMDWHTSGWAVAPVADNDHFIWIRSPYTPAYFKSFAPIANELTNIRVNAEGTLDIKYMAKIGDETLFLGARPLRPGGEPERVKARAQDFVAELMTDQRIARSIVRTGIPGVSRLHETRVAVTTEAAGEALDYIRADARITDIIIASEKDAVDTLFHIARVVTALGQIHHVNAVRLRSLKFAYHPEAFTPAVIDRMGTLNRLSIVNPLRLEIETQFLQADELRPTHTAVVRRLTNRGITVYANTPLLGRVNDSPDDIHELAYRCRQAGIEYHHLYVAGLPVQESWNADNPVALYDVVDIATRVRREGSGREVPRYIIDTALGEVDFGLNAVINGAGEDLSVTLQPYDLDYYRSMDSTFTWPENVTVSADAKPIIPLSGLKKTTDFALS